MSSLGEVALQDPAAIENMITNNGNGTYSVRFFVNGQPDYVTVNEQLPTMSGYHWANGAKQEFANGTSDNWVGLVEKASAELNAQTNAPHGYALSGASDSYAGLDEGTAAALTMVTDQQETGIGLSARDTGSQLAAILSSVQSTFRAGQEVLMSTPGASNGNLVGGHMYMITGVNAANDTLTIRNPWGSSYNGPLATTFTESIQQLAANNCTLYVTSGQAV